MRRLCFAVGFLVLSGCSSPSQEAMQSYQAYQDAMRSGDAQAIQQRLTGKHADELKDPKKLELLRKMLPPSVKVDQVKVEGQRATLELSIPPESAKASGRVENLAPAQILKGHQAAVDQVACSSDGRFLVTASNGDYSVRVWSLESGRQVSQANLKGRPTGLVVDDALRGKGHATMLLENGRWKLEKEDWSYESESRVLVADDDSVSALPLTEGTLGAPAPLSAQGECLALSPDGKLMATTSFDQPVVVNGRDLGEVWVRQLAFDPTGRFLAGAGRGNEVVIWKTSDWSKRKIRLKKVSAECDAGGVAFSGDGSKLALAMLDTSVVVLDPGSGKELLNSYVSDVSMWDVCFLADGDTLATAGNNGDIYLWSLSKGGRIGQLKGHHDGVRSLTLAGQALISGSEDRSVIVWRPGAAPVATPTKATTQPPPARVDPEEGHILGQPNLLRNPKANQGAARWRKDGEASVEEGRFTVRHGGSFWQDVVLPPSLRSGVVVLVARVSSERVNPDGDITGLPYLYGYLMESEEQITDYLQGDSMRSAATTRDQVVPVWGIYDLKPSTTRVRVFLNQASGGSSPTDSAARFDDLGLVVLPDRSAAEDFVARYRQ